MPGVQGNGPPSVLVVGDVMVDVLVRPDGPLVTGADRTASIRAAPGGSGANTAVWLAASGVRTRFAGRVGRADHHVQRQLFAEAGVEAVLAADEHLPTGTVVALISSDGERSFFTDRGANRHLCTDDLPKLLLDDVDLVHVSAYALFEPGPRNAVLALAAGAKARGIPISIDMASHSFLSAAGPGNVLLWAEWARLCFANSAEAAVLTGTAEPAAQIRALLGSFDTVVIKGGADGARAGAAGGQWFEPAPAVAVADTTGAGDAFVAGFLGAFLRGEGVAECLRNGVQSGSRAVTIPGARPPGPSGPRSPDLHGRGDLTKP